jgi:hypothetical protein
MLYWGESCVAVVAPRHSVLCVLAFHVFIVVVGKGTLRRLFGTHVLFGCDLRCIVRAGPFRGARAPASSRSCQARGKCWQLVREDLVVICDAGASREFHNVFLRSGSESTRLRCNGAPVVVIRVRRSRSMLAIDAQFRHGCSSGRVRLRRAPGSMRGGSMF